MVSFITGVALAAAEQAQTVIQRKDTIDFSQLDSLLGVVVGATAVGGIGLIILWGAIKAGVLCFSRDPAPPQVSNGPQQVGGYPPGAYCAIPQICPEHGTERERSLTNQRGIDALWKKFDDMSKRMDGWMETNRQVQTQLLLGMIKAGHLPESAMQALQIHKQSFE